VCRTSREEDVEDSDSPIAKRVRNKPRVLHPSILQSSPYVNSSIGVGKGKHACTDVYTLRKRTKPWEFDTKRNVL